MVTTGGTFRSIASGEPAELPPPRLKTDFTEAKQLLYQLLAKRQVEDDALDLIRTALIFRMDQEAGRRSRDLQQFM